MLADVVDAQDRRPTLVGRDRRADALLEHFKQVERVSVRVRKPEVDPGASVEYAAASVRRERR